MASQKSTFFTLPRVEPRKRLLRLSTTLSRCLLFCLLATLLKGSDSIRVKRTGFIDDESIRTEYVDKNNQTILDMFNLTRAQLSRIAAGNNAENKETGAAARDSHFFEDIKEHRINDIKVRLESAFQGSTSEESQEHPLHEMAAYPICNSESNESSWLHDNNVTIRFSDSLFEPKRDNLNLDSAILRLYKVNPNGTDQPSAATSLDGNHNKPKRCVDPLLDSQIRVTVSIVQQLRRNKRERKKRICNTIMMNISQTGWVEIDIKRAIYIWESVERQQQQLQQQQQQQQPQQQQQQQQYHHQHQPHHQQHQHLVGGRQPILVGWLMIEVHDEEERPLKPGLFFKPPKCDQADFAIPWNYYRPHTSLSSIAEDEVPRSPRLDVKLIGYAAFAPKELQNKQLHDQLHLNLRRQLYHLTRNSAEIENELTTFTPTADNLLEASASTEILQRHRKRHSHQRDHQHQQHQQLQHQQHDQRRIHTAGSEGSSNEHQQEFEGHRQHRLHKRHNQQHQQQQHQQVQQQQ